MLGSSSSVFAIVSWKASRTSPIIYTNLLKSEKIFANEVFGPRDEKK